MNGIALLRGLARIITGIRKHSASYTGSLLEQDFQSESLPQDGLLLTPKIMFWMTFLLC